MRQVVFTAGELARAVCIASSAIERRAVLPILGCLRLQASVDHVRLTGTDLDLAVTVDAQAQIYEESDLVIPARPLLQIARAFPADSLIRIKSQDESDRVIVDADDARFWLNRLDAKDWPPVPSMDTTQATPFSVNLPAAFRRLAPFMSQEETRYYLCGAHLSSNEIVATNGHILGRVAVPGVLLPDVIVPSKATKLITRFIKSESPTCMATRVGLTCSAGGVSIATKLIDGTFPDIKRLIPTVFEGFAAELPRAKLIAAMQKAQISGLDEPSGVLALSAGVDGFATVRSRSAIINIGRKAIKAGETAFNGAYGRQVVDFLRGDEIWIRASGDGGKNGPLHLRGDGDDFALLMPMRWDGVKGPTFDEVAA